MVNSMYSPNYYDTLIIGAGPAGLASAMALGRAGRRVAVFDSQEYRNERSEAMHNVVLHDGQKPREFRYAAKVDITTKYPTVIFHDTEIKSVVTSPVCKSLTGFTVQTSRGIEYQGKKIILATGCQDIMAEVPGYTELWGNGIVHYLFCDGYEQSDGPIGVLGLDSLQDISPILMAYHLTNSSMTIFLNGEVPTTEKEQTALRVATARGCQVNHQPIQQLLRKDKGVGISFQDGSYAFVNFLMHTPDTVNRAEHLISSLGVKTVGEDLHIEAQTPFGETNVRGCFSAGDIAAIAKVVAVALATGTMAGIGAARQLALDEGCEAAFLGGGVGEGINNL
ncbi:hypothetical protein PENSTE_c031G09756 [Penicillium steckii]|uniref:FAD/NAD(P)-binding domain-containing protein n=1 Tax=Penicillium steckii TaxID=303698 RepID=A0A1V6SMP1_9EURO|nr:hypothetical protein PENSTE_c031G09756 [Penicillium steckii]